MRIVKVALTRRGRSNSGAAIEAVLYGPKERVNAINSARELENVYFDRSCQNGAFKFLMLS